MATDTEHWFINHDNLVITASWMADNGYSAGAVARMIEKPWTYEDEFKAARIELGESAAKPTPGQGDELFPEGRQVWYEGDDPRGFLVAIKERFDLELELKEDQSGFAFFCPPGYVDAIVYTNEWPIGT
jgi:hypothetical protein